VVDHGLVFVKRVLLLNTEHEVAGQTSDGASHVAESNCLCSSKFEEEDHYWDNQAAAVDSSKVSETKEEA